MRDDFLSTRRVKRNMEQAVFSVFQPMCVTCASSFQTGAVSCDESSIPALSRLSHTHLEGTARDVRPVELHVDDVDAVLSRDEANRVLV